MGFAPNTPGRFGARPVGSTLGQPVRLSASRRSTRRSRSRSERCLNCLSPCSAPRSGIPRSGIPRVAISHLFSSHPIAHLLVPHLFSPPPPSRARCSGLRIHRIARASMPSSIAGSESLSRSHAVGGSPRDVRELDSDALLPRKIRVSVHALAIGGIRWIEARMERAILTPPKSGHIMRVSPSLVRTTNSLFLCAMLCKPPPGSRRWVGVRGRRR